MTQVKRYVIEAGGRFSGPQNGVDVGVYLAEYNRAPEEPDNVTVLQWAAHGAVGSKVINDTDFTRLRTMLATEQTRSPFGVPERITPLVRFVMGRHFHGLLASYSGALLGRLTHEELMETSPELLKEYNSLSKHLADAGEHLPLPTHVNNRGFVQIVPKVRYPHINIRYTNLDYTGVYRNPNLTARQQAFAREERVQFTGRYVPLEARNGEPVVIGDPVPTLGKRYQNEYEPRFILHTPSPQDWERFA